MATLGDSVSVVLTGNGKKVDVTAGSDGEIKLATGEPSSAAFDHAASVKVANWETIATATIGGNTLLSSVVIDHTSVSFEAFTRSVWASKRELPDPVSWNVTSIDSAWDEVWDGINAQQAIGIHPKAGVWASPAALTEQYETGDMWSGPLETLSEYIAWGEHGDKLYAAPIGENHDGGIIKKEWFTEATRGLSGDEGASRVTQLRIRYGQDLVRQAVFPFDTPTPLLQATADYPELSTFEQAQAVADTVLPDLSAASSPAAALNQRVIDPDMVPWDALKPGFRYWDQISGGYAVLNTLSLSVTSGKITEAVAEWERPGLALIKKRLPSI